MDIFNLVMPKMGESIQEATITKWFVAAGDKIEEDDVLVEIATDKVDSEIPSPIEGIVKEILFTEGETVAVNEIIATIALNGENIEIDQTTKTEQNDDSVKEHEIITKSLNENTSISKKSDRFYSPLVKNIAKNENIKIEELNNIEGTGRNGRVSKDDILNYIENNKTRKIHEPTVSPENKTAKVSVSINANEEIIEMDRMRKMIADHMVMSKQISAHVTSVVEADVTNIFLWRKKNKSEFQDKHGVKLTYMPIFTEAVAKALIDFPSVNASVDGYNIILKKDINIGIAVALPTGNLIVPVIKQAGQKNLIGISKDLNNLASAARSNKLTPDEIQGGTFTITNFGTFRNIIGTPIINQPQVAILATGSIEKKPAVIETPTGDTIGIRHKMFLSLSYDHRVVDGALGGAFLRRIADYLEEFDLNRKL